MRSYYNEWDPFPAQWLRNLIDAGLIPPGDVDTRSITDVHPTDLIGYSQCHFFAGIGGWAFAARLAGWPDGRQIWTGSTPCQPYSLAGEGKGQEDERHLWPYLFKLIRARRPALFLGEQVAAAVGRNWVDGVLADLATIGYASRALVVPACAVNAPHRRDRLWTLAHTNNPGPQGLGRDVLGSQEGWREPARFGAAAGLLVAAERQASLGDRGSADHWGSAAWLQGHDGKERRIESGIPLLAHGLSGRVAALRPGFDPEDRNAAHWYGRAGALKGFGNAIVPQIAAEMIAAYRDCYPPDFSEPRGGELCI